MSESERTVPGERLAKRLDERTRRRPRFGFAPEFYARHGLDDPWAPPADVGADPTSTDGGMVFLSGAPYYEMMRRLARARRRRERREAASAARRPGSRARVTQRRWPGEVPGPVASLARETWSDFVLPRAEQEAPTVVTEEAAAPTRGRRASARTRVFDGASAWGTAGGVRGSTPVGEGARPSTAAALTTLGTVRPAPIGASPSSPVARPSASTSVIAASPRQGLLSATPSPTAYLRPAAPRVADAERGALAPIAPRPPRRRALAHAGLRIEAEEAAWVENIAALAPAARRREVVRIVTETRGLPATEREVVILREVRSLTGVAARDVAPSRARARAEGPTVRALSRSPALALASSADTDRAAAQTLASRATAPMRSPAWTPRLPQLTGLAGGDARLDLDRAVAERPASASTARAATPFAAMVARPVLASAVGVARGSSPPSPAESAPLQEKRSPGLPPLTARALARVMGADVVAGPRMTQPASTGWRDVGPVDAQGSVVLSPRAGSASLGVALERGSLAATRSLVPYPVAGRAPAAPIVRALVAGELPVSSAGPWTSGGAGALARRVAAREAEIPSGAQGIDAPVPGSTRRPAGVPGTGSLLVAHPIEAPAAPSNVVAAPARPSAFAPALASGLSPRPPAAVPPSGVPGVLAAVSASAPEVSPRSSRLTSAVHAAARADQVSGLPRATGSSVAPGGPTSTAAVFAPVSSSRVAHGGVTLLPPTSYGHAFARGEALRPATEAVRYVAAPRGVLAVSEAHAAWGGGDGHAPAVGAGEVVGVSARLGARADGAATLPAVRMLSAGAAGVVGTVLARAADAASVEASVGGASPAKAGPAARVGGPAAPSGFAGGERAIAMVPPSVGAGYRALHTAVVLGETVRGLVGTPSVAAWVAAARRAGVADPVPVGIAAGGSREAGSVGPTSRRPTGPLAWVQALGGGEGADHGLRLSQRGLTVRSVMRGDAAVTLALPGPAAGTDGAASGVARGGASGVTPGARVGAVGATPTLVAGASGRTHVGAVASAAATPPATPTASPLVWAASRADVSRATAYGGALGDVTPEPGGERRRSRAVGAGGAAVLAQRESAPGVDETLAGPAGPTRAPLARRLHGLSVSGAPNAEDPSWSSRADGTSRVHSVSGLFEALARARDTEEVVRVLFLRADGLRDAPAAVRAPVQAVVDEIRQEVARTTGEGRASTLTAPATEPLRPHAAAAEAATPSGPSGRRPVRSAAVREAPTRVTAAWRGALSVRSGDERVMRLVRKLSELVHLAEAEHRRSDARKQVRMAEDSQEARAEAGHGAPRAGAPAPDEKVDVDALVRAVVHAVTEELSSRRQRRSEDPDESVWW